MKRFLKWAGITLLIAALVAVAAFTYVDYKVSKMMAGMAKQKEIVAVTPKDNDQETAEPQENAITDENTAIAESANANSEDIKEEVSVLNEGENLAGSDTDESQKPDVVEQVKASVDTTEESEIVKEDPVKPVSVQTGKTQSETPVEEKADIEEKSDVNVQNTEAIPVEVADESMSDEETVTETVEEEEAPSVEEMEDEVNWAEKAKAYDMALSRLTSAQVSRLYEMSNGGFTPEEKKEAKEMFYANFTAEEQEWILEMYRKYY